MSVLETRTRPVAPGGGQGGGIHPTRAATGLALVALGIAWLLDNAGVVDIPWRLLPSVALIALGGTLLLVPATRRSGLVPLGVLLAVASTVLTAVPAVPIAGIGDRIARPLAAAEVRPAYELSIGQLTLDLSSVEFTEPATTIEARVGIGELVVRVPRGVALSVEARSGAGELNLLGRRQDGLGVSEDYRSPDYASSERRLDLELSVGTGSIEVRR
jgi:hypothetical protein